LSSSGHIAALVNPPGNPKASFQTNKDTTVDAPRWLRSAHTQQGSWWPDFAAWLADRSGASTPAPTDLGGGGLRPLAEAPGTYVYQS
jgi:polyhydroxyalkanoate synthase subunit PhaC